jgi:hypothetical protein
MADRKTLDAAFDAAPDGSAAQWDAKRAVIAQRVADAANGSREKTVALATLASHDDRKTTDDVRKTKEAEDAAIADSAVVPIDG